jgi:hypothetical protein
MIDNIQYVTDETGKQVSVLIPIEEWNAIEQAKDILEHVYLSGLIETRSNDVVSCDMEDLLKAEGISRHELTGQIKEVGA